MNGEILGAGSYGQVYIKNGKAVKKFAKLSHIIQEYVALEYLKDCQYVVKCRDVSFEKLELSMELHDCSLRNYIDEQRLNGPLEEQLILRIIKDILLGLVELHDRSLAHGDIKPGNILVKRNPLKCVLGDCGFVSIAKYSKVERTAAVYRDMVIRHHPSHDIYSLGICCIELFGDIKISRQTNYETLKKIIKSKIHNKHYSKFIQSLVHSDYHKRPTARMALNFLFGLEPARWNKSNDSLNEYIVKYDSDRNRKIKEIKDIMKDNAKYYAINRGKKGYGALLRYIETHQVSKRDYISYTAVVLMILSAIFGKSGFREKEAMSLMEEDESEMYKILNELSSDKCFINSLFSP